ncbi:MAG: hypothetical protein ACR2QZ_04440 [Woeseiaceae bacterium]
MLPMHRYFCLLLLLFVIAGQALGVAHAATHVGADSGECALCASYGDSTVALPTSGPDPTPVLNQCSSVDLSASAESNSAILCRHQRGPPSRV